MLRRTASQTAGPIGLNFFVVDLMDGQGVLFEICFFFKIFIFLFFCSNFFSRETPGPSASMYIYFACLNRSGPNFVWHFTCPPGNVWR